MLSYGAEPSPNVAAALRRLTKSFRLSVNGFCIRSMMKLTIERSSSSCDEVILRTRSNAPLKEPDRVDIAKTNDVKRMSCPKQS